MFGTLRLVLAFFVLISHVGINIKMPGYNWFNYGPMALMGFFMLSGYLMKLIFIKNYDNKTKNAFSFYYDRFIRIFPQYYFYTFLILIFVILTNYTKLQLTFPSIFSHLTVLPLNFINIWDIKAFSGWPYWALLIPPAWTLASEFQFYLLIPFLYQKWWPQAVVLFTSLLIFSLAMLGVIGSEAWGYRLLPGMLFTFMTGSILFDINTKSEKSQILKIVFVATYIYMIGLYLLLIKTGIYQSPYNGTVVLGFLLLTPIIYFLSKIKNRPNWDNFLGNFAYGVFLNHYGLIYFFDRIKILSENTVLEKSLRVGVLFPISLLLAFLSYNFIDKRLRNVRIAGRK